MKPIRLSNHAHVQIELRGASEEEVITAINSGKWEPANLGKFKTKHKFDFNAISRTNQKNFKYKTVEPVFADENDIIVVVTVKVYYSND